MLSNGRDLIAGSGTIGAMLLVTGSAKIGYGLWMLGAATLTCVLYVAGKYVVRGSRFLRMRLAPVAATATQPKPCGS